MTIITDLYNRVLNFFNTEKEDENSKSTACNRLKLVLMQDRAKLDPAIMEQLRQEMIEVISKYIEIDTEALGLNLAAEGDTCALMLNIPVIRAKTLEEIEEAKKIATEKSKDDDDDDDENDETDEEDKDDNEYYDIESDEDEDDEDNDDDETDIIEDEVVEEAKEVELIKEDKEEVSLEFDDPYVIHEDLPSKKTNATKKKSKDINK